MAYLCTETTDYRYLEKLDAPKKWFQTNVDLIMQTYGSQHRLQKEDLFLGQSYTIPCRGRKPTEFLQWSAPLTPQITPFSSAMAIQRDMWVLFHLTYETVFSWVIYFRFISAFMRRPNLANHGARSLLIQKYRGSLAHYMMRVVIPFQFKTVKSPIMGGFGIQFCWPVCDSSLIF